MLKSSFVIHFKSFPPPMVSPVQTKTSSPLIIVSNSVFLPLSSTITRFICFSAFFPRGGSCGFSRIENEDNKTAVKARIPVTDKNLFILFHFNFYDRNKDNLTSFNQS